MKDEETVYFDCRKGTHKIVKNCPFEISGGKLGTIFSQDFYD